MVENHASDRPSSAAIASVSAPYTPLAAIIRYRISPSVAFC
jgi:hypothetical protein